MIICRSARALPRTAERVADVDGDHGAPDVSADRDARAQLHAEGDQEHVGDHVIKPCRVRAPLISRDSTQTLRGAAARTSLPLPGQHRKAMQTDGLQTHGDPVIMEAAPAPSCRQAGCTSELCQCTQLG